ncbi:MAG: TIGR02530 family flagellar biosynthesis protein [Bacillota bacterium]
MSNRIYSKQLIAPHQTNQPVKQREDLSSSEAFNQVLQRKLKQRSGIEFSGHAQQRVSNRNINLTTQQLDKLEAGVSKAAEKGAKESLIVVDQVAYVVSVENKTVITAVDQESMQENVFTNIDSAVMMD